MTSLKDIDEKPVDKTADAFNYLKKTDPIMQAGLETTKADEIAKSLTDDNVTHLFASNETSKQGW